MAEKEDEPNQSQSLHALVSRLNEIQAGFRLNVANLHDKLETIDSRPELLGSIEDAKMDAEDRANELEEEVKELKDELKAIKEMLDLNLEKK